MKQRKFWLVGGFSDCDFDEVQVGWRGSRGNDN